MMRRCWVGVLALLVVAGAAPDTAALRDASGLDGEIAALLDAGESARAIAARLAGPAGLPKRAVYARVVALRRDRDPAGESGRSPRADGAARLARRSDRGEDR